MNMPFLLCIFILFPGQPLICLRFPKKEAGLSPRLLFSSSSDGHNIHLLPSYLNFIFLLLFAEGQVNRHQQT